MTDKISNTLLRQRVRNRLIEYFEWAASLETIAGFGAFETINAWEDWVASPDLSWFQEPVFSRQEKDAIATFYSVWDAAAEATEEDIFDAAKLSQQEAWIRFQQEAAGALKTFLERGRFSEEEEAFK